jgi:hypothetical protein
MIFEVEWSQLPIASHWANTGEFRGEVRKLDNGTCPVGGQYRESLP